MSILSGLDLGGVSRSGTLSSDEEREYVLSYVVIRLAVGGIGILLPAFLFFLEAFFLDAPVHTRDSLSSYYHSPARDWFVGSLCVIGLLLITYMWGQKTRNANFWKRKKAEARLSTVAGVCLIGVAFFPTERPHIPTTAPHCGDSPQPPGCTDLEQKFGEVAVGNVHLGFAAVALSLLGVIAFLFSKRAFHRPTPSLLLGRIQLWCGIAIFSGLFVAVSGEVVKWRTPLLDLTPLYVGEVVTVMAFGFCWLAQGVDLLRWVRQTWPLRRPP